jgi:hypothetical protein
MARSGSSSALNGFPFIFLTASSFVASGWTDDWTTGTLKGLDKTNLKPSLRRIFARPGWSLFPPLMIGSISGRMSWLQFIVSCKGMQKACRSIPVEKFVATDCFQKKQCLIIVTAPDKLAVCWTGKQKTAPVSRSGYCCSVEPVARNAFGHRPNTTFHSLPSARSFSTWRSRSRRLPAQVAARTRSTNSAAQASSSTCSLMNQCINTWAG